MNSIKSTMIWMCLNFKKYRFLKTSIVSLIISNFLTQILVLICNKVQKVQYVNIIWIMQEKNWRKHRRVCCDVPSVLEPNLDLLRLNIGENGTLSDELLAAQGTGFGAFMVKPLKCFHLFWCVPHILPVIHCHLAPFFASWTHRHHPCQPNSFLSISIPNNKSFIYLEGRKKKLRALLD